MKELKCVIICWILSFLIYGIIRLWDNKHKDKDNGEE